jgi:hypothetical protein
MERAMSPFTFASLAKGAVTAALGCCVTLPAYAQMHLAAEKVSPQQFDQQLQDTRANIKRQTTTAPAGNAASNQIVIDICKKNPQLPQCKLK